MRGDGSGQVGMITPNSAFLERLKDLLRYCEALDVGKIPFSAQRPPSVSDTPGKETLLRKLREEIGECTRCQLSKQRKSVVFGEGSPEARIMFVGEGPGREEDIQGRPFVGDAGILLTKLITKMGFSRSEVYIGNIVKCRPPLNRDPENEEIDTCRPFIEEQIEIIRPAVIMTLGRIALQSLLRNPALKITASRGTFFDYKGIPVMPTYHPAYLLRNPKEKWRTWNDAQKVLERLGISQARQ